MKIEVVLLGIVILLQLIVIFFILNKRDSRGLKKLSEDTRESFLRLKQELDYGDKNMREELNGNFHRMSESMLLQLTEIMRSGSEQQERLRTTVDMSLKELQDSNEKKLDQMRLTVDEKLEATLSTRLDKSFKQVSERLESLYQSIGEIQSLASDVSDLNRVLNNQKVRGIWGEAQLENLLLAMLTQDQFDKNVATKKGSSDRVEFAVKIPVADDGKSFVYLPVDSKNPASYEAIITASEENDMVALEVAKKDLETRIKVEARTIRDKYLSSQTTDFAIMFLPSEALYSEVIRLRGLAAYVQENYHIMIAGPTTLTALLSSIAVGFRAININTKSKEIVKILQAVKSQYGIFTELLGKSQKKILEASTSIETAVTRANMINKKLSKMDELDLSQAELLLDIDNE